MSQVYKATGIILKGIPFGEADRLLTILSPEVGLLKAIAPNARKPKSMLRGRCELFVVNEFLISQGRSLDKITQIETIESYSKLGRNIGTLAASQYLAELVLCLAFENEPQLEIFSLFNEHLRRLEQITPDQSLHAHLAQAVFHLLALSGYAPQVHYCCLTQVALVSDYLDPHWKVNFNTELGGLVAINADFSVKTGFKPVANRKTNSRQKSPVAIAKPRPVRALEVTLLQQLSANFLPEIETILPAIALKTFRERDWVNIEHLLRDYAQYHLGRTFRAAELVDSSWAIEF
jgi:DNA repair protein RecO (recombination protein O)